MERQSRQGTKLLNRNCFVVNLLSSTTHPNCHVKGDRLFTLTVWLIERLSDFFRRDKFCFIFLILGFDIVLFVEISSDSFFLGFDIVLFVEISSDSFFILPLNNQKACHRRGSTNPSLTKAVSLIRRLQECFPTILQGPFSFKKTKKFTITDDMIASYAWLDVFERHRMLHGQRMLQGTSVGHRRVLNFCYWKHRRLSLRYGRLLKDYEDSNR